MPTIPSYPRLPGPLEGDELLPVWTGGGMKQMSAELLAVYVLASLGYTPYDARNPAGFVTGAAIQAILDEIAGLQDAINALLVKPLDFSATVQLAGTDQMPSLEFVKTWGQSVLNQVTFEISATARDHDSSNGPLTIPTLPFYCEGITKWPLDLAPNGFPPDTEAFLMGDTIAFFANGAAVQTADLAPNFAFRVSGRSIPIVTS